MESDTHRTQGDLLLHYVKVVRRRWAAVVITVIAFVGLTLVYSFLATPTYSSSADVLIPQLTAVAQLSTNAPYLPDSTTLQRVLIDEQTLAQGSAVRRVARGILGFSAPVTVTSSTTADVLTFTAESRFAHRAASVANAYANAYIQTKDRILTAQYSQEIAALRASIDRLQSSAPSATSADATTLSSLSQSLQQLEAASRVVTETGPSVVNPAGVSSSPVSPAPVRNALIGLFLGLLIGIALAMLMERFDDKLSSREEAQRSTGGLPVLGVIPTVTTWLREEGHLAINEDPQSAASEAYRSLRTAVQFLSLDEPKQVIGVTSALPNEGKTTTVANLAVAFARAGRRVIVVSCDLRRPRMQYFFGEGDRRGLTSVLLGDAVLGEVLHEVDGEPLLRVVPTGPLPPNPAELLSNDNVRKVVDSLASHCDILLLDCPPVLPVTDAMLLSRLVDGVMVVAAARTTGRRNLARATEMLRQVDAPLLGVVLNRASASREEDYGYGGYAYEEPSAPKPKAPQHAVRRGARRLPGGEDAGESSAGGVVAGAEEEGLAHTNGSASSAGLPGPMATE